MTLFPFFQIVARAGKLTYNHEEARGPAAAEAQVLQPRQSPSPFLQPANNGTLVLTQRILGEEGRPTQDHQGRPMEPIPPWLRPLWGSCPMCHANKSR